MKIDKWKLSLSISLSFSFSLFSAYSHDPYIFPSSIPSLLLQLKSQCIIITIFFSFVASVVCFWRVRCVKNEMRRRSTKILKNRNEKKIKFKMNMHIYTQVLTEREIELHLYITLSNIQSRILNVLVYPNHYSVMFSLYLDDRYRGYFNHCFFKEFFPSVLLLLLLLFCR